MLVNNVGGYWNTRHVTADGLERTFALNHLAPFLLTDLLLDRLKQSAPARVVTVASNAQALGRIDFDDLQGEQAYSGARAYNQSKLANVLFSYELARRLRGTAVTANALHPGVVSTAFGAEDPGGIQRLFVPFLRPFMKTPAQGAATSIYVASAPELAQVTGRYFANADQAILHPQLRRGDGGTAVAGERRPDRAGFTPTTIKPVIETRVSIGTAAQLIRMRRLAEPTAVLTGEATCDMACDELPHCCYSRPLSADERSF